MTRVGFAADMTPARPLADLIEGFWMTQLIGTSITLGIVDRLALGDAPYEEIARSCGADAGCVLRLVRALQTIGVCRKSPDNRFALTDRGQLLRRGVPGSICGRAIFTSGIMWDLYGHLTDVVRTGRSLPSGRSGFDELAKHPGLDGMHLAMVESSVRIIEDSARAHDFARYARVLDVGGGYGGALGALLQRHTGMTGAVLDLSYLSDRATAHLRGSGVADRAEFVAGDFFESVPAGYNCYLLKYIVHDWGDADALQILQRCAAAASPEADIILLERVLPDELDDSPAHQAIVQIDLAMMTTGGKERTAEEYRSLLARAGLRMIAVRSTASPCSVIHAVTVSSRKYADV
jgi:hypothetical protein